MTIASEERATIANEIIALKEVALEVEENTDMKVLNDLDDVCVNTPNDKELLEYDANDGQWKAGGGGGHTIESHEDTLATGVELEELSDGSETTLHSHAAAGMTYVDRGDPSSVDIDKDDLTLDQTWNEIDLSSIVPVGAVTVHLRIIINAATLDCYLRLRKKGNTSEHNAANCYIPVANKIIAFDKWVCCDSDRIIEYWGHAITWATLDITVAGWIK